MRENGHIFLAQKIKRRVDSELEKLLSGNLNAYLAGAIFPDILYYNSKLVSLAESIHGQNGENTTKPIKQALRVAIENKDDELFAFVCGWATHAIVDIKTHPITYALTGNYYDENNNKRKAARERHVILERIFDKALGPVKDVLELINPSRLNCIFKYLKSSGLMENIKLLKKAYKKRLFYDKLFKSKIAYYIMLLLAKLGIYKHKEKLAFFYAHKNIWADLSEIDLNSMRVPDLKTGKISLVSFNEVIDGILAQGTQTLNELYEIYTEHAPVNSIYKIMPGESFDTGELNFPTRKIQHTVLDDLNV